MNVAEYMIREQAPTRHRAVADVVQWLDFSHLPEGLPRGVAERCAELASDILDVIRVDDPELTRGLSALVQVKDHFVRAAIAQQRTQAAPDDVYRLTDAGKARADAEADDPGERADVLRTRREMAREAGDDEFTRVADWPEAL